MKIWLPFLMLFFALASCEKEDDFDPFNPGNPTPTQPEVLRPGSIGIVGDTSDVKTAAKAGLVIMGGSTDVDEAFRWMIERSDGGDVVIIRASGSDAYNNYIAKLGTSNSVETLKIDSRKLADDPGVVRIIMNAEMLFIAGGDQSQYVDYWKGTRTMDAINYLLEVKKVPVGGTSAGAAILGNYYYTGESGSVTSASALSNPYVKEVTVQNGSFLKAPFMQEVITDQHFSQREREGRMVVFMGRVMKDWDKPVRGIAVDEKTAVLINEAGLATVVGENESYFLKTETNKTPETFEPGKAVTWNRDGKALSVISISGKIKGNQFNVNTFETVTTTGVKAAWWSVVSGKMFFHNQ